jgi:hypothetical protein
MDVMLGQPLGLWMLLGIPVVLAIHFLQSRTQRIEISTLFLLDHVPEENRQGAVLQRLRHSIPLWLQLLAVLLATILLSKPMFLRQDFMQSIALVIDNSYSMTAFTREARETINHETHALDRATARTAWYVLSSDPTRPALYAGDDRVAMLDALTAWSPDSGEHDPSTTFARAKDLVGPQGVVAFVTDHVPSNIPPYVAVVSVGESFEQAGFAGAQTWPASQDALHWRVALLNYGATPVERSWTLEGGADGQALANNVTRIEPGRVRVLEGTTPPGVKRARLVLQSDRFTLDDAVYLARPERPLLRTAITVAHEPSRRWAERVIAALPDLAPAAMPDDAHIAWTTSPGDGAAIVFYDAATNESERVYGDVLAESHPLVEDLSWHDFMGRALPGPPPADNEQVLLWIDEQPLVFVRGTPPNEQLHLRFDVEESNAARHPSLFLLVHRFLEQQRTHIPGTETGMAELNQSMARTGASYARAPTLPGWFTIEHEGVTRFDGAANFAETREADFSAASSRNDLEDISPERAQTLRRADPLAPLWLALLGLTVVGSWYAIARERNRAV